MGGGCQIHTSSLSCSTPVIKRLNCFFISRWESKDLLIGRFRTPLRLTDWDNFWVLVSQGRRQQCDQIWPSLKWSLAILGFNLISIWSNIETQLWQKQQSGNFSLFVNGQILKNNLAVWSHWPPAKIVWRAVLPDLTKFRQAGYIWTGLWAI